MEIVIIALHQNAAMIKHNTEHYISIQILQGTVILEMESESIELKEGKIVALHEHINHSVKAKNRNCFLTYTFKKS